MEEPKQPTVYDYIFLYIFVYILFSIMIFVKFYKHTSKYYIINLHIETITQTL